MIAWASPKAKAYLKRRYVPKQCPVCGVGVGEVDPKNVMASLFKATYDAWRIRPLRHPTWRMVMWYGHCSRCLMRAELIKEDYLLKRLVDKSSVFKGDGTIKIPLKY